MNCPSCLGKTKVQDCRRKKIGDPDEETYVFFRRRKCLSCERAFNTLETPIAEAAADLKLNNQSAIELHKLPSDLVKDLLQLFKEFDFCLNREPAETLHEKVTSNQRILFTIVNGLPPRLKKTLAKTLVTFLKNWDF